VVVGSTPSTDGTAATAQAGCLIVLDSQGKARETISGHGINGPWDMTAFSAGPLDRPSGPRRGLVAQPLVRPGGPNYSPR
jgi:hypothetical protein